MLETQDQASDQARTAVESAVVRFAGDSGDGMQVTGSQFTAEAALAGNDLATFPDFPAEIRAPAGTTFGVSAFQIHFGARRISTIGDQVDVLVAMNPAALKTNLREVKEGGLIVADSGAFTAKNLQKAGYEAHPLEDNSLAGYRLFAIDMSKLTVEAAEGQGLSHRDALRTKNMWALGLILWMFGRPREATLTWIDQKFGAKKPAVAAANKAALNAGHAYGETAELPNEVQTYTVAPREQESGTYRTITGTEALAWGLLAGGQKAGLGLTFCSYPITPASQLLHTLVALKRFGVQTFQAEDEIAAICAALGASYAGNLGITSSSGPGIALKTEALGLAVATELPLIVINSQRGGPSTGLPTKTEQSDLFQAVYGRNGDTPLAVLAARAPGDCFDVAVEAVRIATTYMTPVMLLSDGYLANAAEPWRIPTMADLPDFPPVRFARAEAQDGFQPFQRDAQTLARPWARPGTPGLAHRIGGLEKDHDSGHISYDPENHQRMTDVRADKIARIADSLPPQGVEQGPERGDLAIVGWGSTYGPIARAVTELNADGRSVAHIHLRHLSPFPANLGTLLAGYDRVLVPEMNTGQLLTMLRATYLVPAQGLNKVAGKPFKVAELVEAAQSMLKEKAA